MSTLPSVPGNCQPRYLAQAESAHAVVCVDIHVSWLRSLATASNKAPARLSLSSTATMSCTARSRASEPKVSSHEPEPAAGDGLASSAPAIEAWPTDW